MLPWKRCARSWIRAHARALVIGEGERDEAPMLYIGEEVGGGYGVSGTAESVRGGYRSRSAQGTSVPLGSNNAIAVLAADERGGL